jgi:hypothetical protein
VKGVRIVLDFIEPFQVAVLFRTDVARVGLTFEQIEALSNMDMVKIANRMGRLYLENGFLSHLEQAVSEVLAEKESQP